MVKDPYAILELTPPASVEQIRRQYRLLAHAWHPDKFHSPEQRQQAEERLKAINAAYNALMDPQVRARLEQEQPPNEAPPTGRVRQAAGAPAERLALRRWAGLALLALGALAGLAWLLWNGADYPFPARQLAAARETQPGRPAFQPGVQAPAPQVAGLLEAEKALQANTPFLDELADETTTPAPNEQVYHIHDLAVNQVLVGWKLCVQTQAILDAYWPNLAYTLTVDRTSLGGAAGANGFHSLDFTAQVQTPAAGTRPARCRLLYAVLYDWPPGDHQIEVAIRSNAPLDTGWEQFPGGMNSRRVYQVTVRRRLIGETPVPEAP